MASDRLLSHPQLIGAILTGGSSRRFGGEDKAAVIGPTVLRAFRDAGVDPVVAIGGTPGVLPVPTIADRYPGEGPLGALATALTFARTGWVLVATCDLGALDAATVATLIESLDPAAPNTAVVASVRGEPSVMLGCWPATWAQDLHRAIRAGERRFRHAFSVGQMLTVDVAPDRLLDADDQTTWDALRDRTTAMPDPSRRKA